MSLIAPITKHTGHSAHAVFYETVARQCRYALAATNRTFCGERTLLHDSPVSGDAREPRNAGGCVIRLAVFDSMPLGPSHAFIGHADPAETQALGTTPNCPQGVPQDI